MSTPQEAWAALLATVDAWHSGDRDDMQAKRALHDGVLAYAAARGGAVAKPQPTRVADDRGPAPFVVGFGRSKGKTLAECETDDLRWLAGAYQRSIDDPTKARWLDANCAALDAVNAELETR
jgi:hypothetical protein